LPDSNSNPLFIILGALLAFAGTSLVEYGKWRRNRRDQNLNFRLLAKQELKVVHKTLDKLKGRFEAQRYWDYMLLDQLKKSVTDLEGYKRDSISLRSVDHQENYIDLVSDLSFFEAGTRGLQIFYYQQKDLLKGVEKESGVIQKIFKTETELQSHFDRVSMEKTIEIVELIRRSDELAKELERK